MPKNDLSKKERNILGRMHRWLSRFSLGQSVILASFMVLALLIGLLMAFTSRRSGDIIAKELQASHQQAVLSVAGALTAKLDEANRVATMITRQERIVSAMEKTTFGLDYPLADQLHDVKLLENLLYELEFSHHLMRVRLKLRGSPLYVNEAINFFPLSEDEMDRLYMLREQGVTEHVEIAYFPYIFQNGQSVVTVTRPVYSTTDLHTIIGAVSVDVRIGEIISILQHMLTGVRSSIQIHDSQNNTLLAVGDEALSGLSLNTTPGWTFLQDSSAMVFGTMLGQYDWFLSYRISHNELMQPLITLHSELIAAVLLVLVSAFLLILLTSRITLYRVRKLADAMRLVWRGDMTVRVPVYGSNELGVLEGCFNYLLDTLQDTLAHKVADADALQSMQFRLLQTQIQPHFLYNTLDLINWRLLLLGDQEGSDIVQALARYYKIGLNRGEEFISLRDELEHVASYVKIQNFRYNGRITLTFDVPEPLLDALTMGNLLQPLVENSILHGILETEDHTGTIEISAELCNGDLAISIGDNGVGVDAEAMKELPMNNGKHYGLWNIQQRLQLICGTQYGLSYKAREPSGLIVKVLIPYRHFSYTEGN